MFLGSRQVFGEPRHAMADLAWKIVRMNASAFIEAFKGGWRKSQ